MYRVIAHYLPQFHPVRENDEWWGKGFTEWTNVTKSQPKFQQHYQPRLPSDLGFTDLRLREVCEAQEALALANGVYGFCYYHYWFSGKRILERPLENKLGNPNQKMPFMICWANESWNRSWSRQEKEILLEQKYLSEDIERHFMDLLPIITDKRYITVNGKPVVAIYDPSRIPYLSELLTTWQEMSIRHGLTGIYFMCCEAWLNDPAEKLGFDSSYQFFPNNQSKPKQLRASIVNRVKARFGLSKERKAFNSNYISEYSELMKTELNRNFRSRRVFPGLVPGWDNSARRSENALIIHNSSPELFSQWLHEIGRSYIPFDEEENFIFINAWNEWAEGAHLEPDMRFGCKYLDALREFKRTTARLD